VRAASAGSNYRPVMRLSMPLWLMVTARRGAEKISDVIRRSVYSIFLRVLVENVNRVLRGGSWNNNGRNVRSAYRNGNDPGNRNDNIGLRLSRARGVPDGIL
jgi:hypothetical protein